VIDAVALPIEQQVNGVEGMIYMQSYSGADGSYSLTVTFKIGVDLIYSAGAGAEPGLERVVVAAAGRAGARRHRAEELDGDPADRDPELARPALRQSLSRHYATIKLKDEIARLSRGRHVFVFGAGQYSMRVWLDPSRMQARELVPQDVIQALQQTERAGHRRARSAPRPHRRANRFQYTLNGRRQAQ